MKLGNDHHQYVNFKLLECHRHDYQIPWTKDDWFRVTRFFANTSFTKIFQKMALEVNIFVFFQSENVSKSSDSKLWTYHDFHFISENDWRVTESSGPIIFRKFNSLMNTWFSQSVLNALQNHSRNVCVTMRQFC